MAATISELGAAGYTALRVESVAERAGVNKSTIYRRWGDKSGLVAAVLLERQSEVAPLPDTGDLRNDLVAHLGEIRELLHTPWFTSLAAELGRPGAVHDDGGDGAVREVFDAIWPARLRLSRTMFVRAVERGELPACADPDFLVEALSGPPYFRRVMLGRELDDGFLARTADLVIAGALASGR